VINLRGGFGASFRALEVEACARLGLELVDFVIASRDVPTAEKVLGARDLFETVRYPALMHCKSGADRAGIMAVFYKHFRQGQSIRQALAQPAGLTFVEWVQSPAYDPAAMKAEFRAGWWGTLLSDRLLRRE
jgi:protein tyrosine/serine phosphatase